MIPIVYMAGDAAAPPPDVPGMPGNVPSRPTQAQLSRLMRGLRVFIFASLGRWLLGG